jgi:hypothetical protein
MEKQAVQVFTLPGHWLCLRIPLPDVQKIK